MKRIVLALISLALVFSSASAVTYTKGKKGRKYVRRFSLGENLKKDKLRVYRRYGYTPHRLRYRGGGRVTERWRYYSVGLEFIFDGDGNLVAKRSILPQSDHID